MTTLIIALPLFAGLFTGIFNRIMSKEHSAIITFTCVACSALLSSYVFYQVVFCHEIYKLSLWTWLKVGAFQVNIAMYIDKLTAIMLVVVTTVSSVVHLYSAGYMYDDQNMPRFMSYISLFTASMLVLVVSNNFGQLFLGWEGVGVCSYLLIGFWYKKDSANNASIKAFVVNRIADLALMTSIIVLYSVFGTLEFQSIFHNISQAEGNYINIFGNEFSLMEFIALLIFIGCMGKSAQIGLHVWLPDAMEGPTPVSGLIHAATMVTAGVFLLARCSFIIEQAPYCKEFILIIGSLTSLMAAFVAIAQDDIKKIIAYSTCSQLGYMFIACGLGQYHLAIFHLFTHAFFKAMLFLGAGSIIHALHHEQNINKMGGLASDLPITHVFFWIGSLAIMGIYPFAGYFSKDMIIESAYATSPFAYVSSLIAALGTGIYSIKILLKVFYGKKAFSSDLHPHEAPLIMNGPMGLLALGSIFAGMFGSKLMGIGMDSPEFYDGAMLITHTDHHIHHEDGFSLISSIILYAPTLAACLGMMSGYIMFSKANTGYSKKSIAGSIYNILSHKFYFDELYQLVIVDFCDYIAKMMKIFDKSILDASGPGLFSNLTICASRIISSIHPGIINAYVTIWAASIAASLSLMLYLFVL
ncbi:MAG: NADH-quinone oxidoreductase subunit L [Alphaproteobacteria bacterium]|nr:NADH-quinone oxidoreductase subunit L [Alphaproteobacteria bacterium]